MNALQLVTQKTLSRREIVARRKSAQELVRSHSETLARNNFTAVGTEDLRLLFDAYDSLFFDGAFDRFFADLTHQLSFRLSKRMTNAGGMTSYVQDHNRGSYEIAISTTLLFNTRFNTGRPVRVGGLETFHRLDALQRIFEHEMVHLLELCVWRQSSCAAHRFKSLVHRLFGHRESNHQLITPAESAKSQFGVRVGDQVVFKHQGQTFLGYINNIQRRATVLVEHPQGELYRDKKRYAKYYVPLDQLRRMPH